MTVIGCISNGQVDSRARQDQHIAIQLLMPGIRAPSAECSPEIEMDIAVDLMCVRFLITTANAALKRKTNVITIHT